MISLLGTLTWQHLLRTSQITLRPIHYERAARLGVLRSGICDAMKRIGITIKKTLTHPKASEAERTAFQEQIAAHEAAGKPICLY